jgi:hypothetical protein
MSILTTILLTLIPLATHFSNVSHSMLSVAMIFSGVSRAYVLIPNMIMLQYFDVHQNFCLNGVIYLYMRIRYIKLENLLVCKKQMHF